jgi:hypothetical protein
MQLNTRDDFIILLFCFLTFINKGEMTYITKAELIKSRNTWTFTI